MGKIHHILLAIVFVMLTFSACGGDKDNQITNKDTTVQPEQPSGDVVLQSLSIGEGWKSEAVMSERQLFLTLPVKIIGHYSDGSKREVTDFVHMKRGSTKGLHFRNGKILAYGTGELLVDLDGVTMETLKPDVRRKSGIVEMVVKQHSATAHGCIVQLTLLEQPTSDVKMKLHLENGKGVRFQDESLEKTVTFKKERWINDGVYEEIELHYNDLNTTEDVRLYADPLVTDDANLNGKTSEELIIHKEPELILYQPIISQLRGALPGVTIMFRVESNRSVHDYSLINPPKGMKIIERYYPDTVKTPNELSGVDIEWKVPADMSAGIQNITVSAKDADGKEGSVTFGIEVPKTRPIQTELKNNELIVTDPNSLLYGMKMKGHNGEDISNMELRSVDYKQLWRKRIKLGADDVPQYVPFVMYNMPEKLDVKFPEYLDSVEKAKNLNALFIRYPEKTFSLTGDSYWKGAFNFYSYENTNGSIILNEADNANIFLIIIGKSQLVTR